METNVSNLRQSIINMQYGWTKPATLVVLIPVVSLIVQRMQLNHLQQAQDIQRKSKIDRLDTINKWHTFGSLIQTICLIALSFFYPLLLVPAAISIIQMYASSRGLVHQEIIHVGNNDESALLNADEYALLEPSTYEKRGEHSTCNLHVDEKPEVAKSYVTKLITSKTVLEGKDWDLLFPNDLPSLCQLLKEHALNPTQLCALTEKAVVIANREDYTDFFADLAQTDTPTFTKNMQDICELSTQESYSLLQGSFTYTSRRDYMDRETVFNPSLKSATRPIGNPQNEKFATKTPPASLGQFYELVYPRRWEKVL
jgi:hypothetical protein